MSDTINGKNYKDFLDEVLRQSVALNASDIHVKVGLPPIVRITGVLRPLSRELPRLKPDDTLQLARAILNNQQWERFEGAQEIDMGYGVQGSGRFRINIFRQRGTVGMVARAIPYEVKTIDELGLPAMLKKIAAEQRGLVLVTGATGHGKSTTLAAMIQDINMNRTAHIITIEDPIEFLIRDRKSIITQREVSLDTRAFSDALKHALRQDPDVILVGEMRDEETINIALVAAETGHLVFSTLHTSDASETINRIVSVFPAHQHQQVRMQLASVLRAVVSQRLIPKKDGRGQVVACEIMVVNGRIREMIVDPKKTSEIRSAIEESAQFGMQSFDQALMDLLKKDVITYQDALEASSNPADFELRYKGVSSMDGAKWNMFDGGIEVKNGDAIDPGVEDLRDTMIEVENPTWQGKTHKRKK